MAQLCMMDFGNFKVCPAIKEDVKEIVRFIQEAKDLKKEVFPRRIGEDLLKDGFGDKQHFHCLLVKEKSQSTSSKHYSPEDCAKVKTGEPIIGFVLYFYLFSTSQGHFLFIEDLLISSKYKEQHKIINLMLIQECARIAVEKNCSRLQFNILRDDYTSLEIYSPMGAFTKPEFVTFRFPNKALISLANKENKEVSKKFKIRSPNIKDMSSIMYMIQCIAEFENEPNCVEVDDNVVFDSFEKYCDCFVGESLIPVSSEPCTSNEADDLISSKMPHDDRIAGMAVYLTMYCKREGKVLHLEDVYVLPQYRNQGLGTELIKECAKVGLLRGCNEMDLQALDWNTKAVDLYRRLDGILISEFVPLLLAKDKLPSLASLCIEDFN